MNIHNSFGISIQGSSKPFVVLCDGFHACISNSYHIDKGRVFPEMGGFEGEGKLKFCDADV
jgi:hypothetical protein